MFIPLLQDISWVIPLRSEALTEYFKLFMVFGQPAAYVFLLAAFYWYSGSRLSLFLMFTTCVATFVCNFLKLMFQIPRPPVEYHLIDASSFGFPSGDVVLVATFWTVLSLIHKNKYLTTFTIFLIPSVMMSRLYLGVHSPLDVSVGMIVGVATAIALTTERFQTLFDNWLNKSQLKTYWIAVFLGFLATLLLYHEHINNPISIAFGAFFGLGFVLQKGALLNTPRPSLYILSAAITMLAALYVFIPSTLISGHYKWINQTIKFSVLTIFAYHIVPKLLHLLQQDEDLKDA